MVRPLRSLFVSLTACFVVARAFAVEIEAGPIWADMDAQRKCPQVCSGAGGQWKGQWRTTQPGRMSVCDCTGVSPPPPVILPYRPPSGTGPVIRYEKTEFVGNDIGRDTSATFDRCASVCLADPRCVAFSYGTAGTCDKKSAVGNIKETMFATSGYLSARGAPPPVPGYAAPQAPAPAMAPNSCSVGGTAKCPGCSIACNPGERPVCTPPFDGFTSFCQRDASCSCTTG
jgi:hypothetical protein